MCYSGPMIILKKNSHRIIMKRRKRYYPRCQLCHNHLFVKHMLARSAGKVARKTRWYYLQYWHTNEYSPRWNVWVMGVVRERNGKGWRKKERVSLIQSTDGYGLRQRNSVTRLGNLLDLGQVFKAFGNNYFT